MTDQTADGSYHLARVLAASVLIATALFMRLGALPQLLLRHPPWPIIDLSHQDNIMDTYWGSIAWNAAAQVFGTYIYIICVVGCGLLCGIIFYVV